MRHDLAKQNNQIIQGSLAQVAKANNQSIAQAFINADCVVYCDTSGSMNYEDAPGNKSRYEALIKELKALQSSLPGKIAVISFSSLTPVFCPNGVPVMLNGGTLVAKALEFGKVADIPGAMRFILISDGEMSDGHEAIQIASTYKNRIDVIYVGPENLPAGREALRRLAKASGGQTITADRTSGLAIGTRKLLEMTR